MILRWCDNTNHEGSVDTNELPPMLPKDAPLLVASRLFGRKNSNPDATLVEQVDIHYSDGSVVRCWVDDGDEP